MVNPVAETFTTPKVPGYARLLAWCAGGWVVLALLIVPGAYRPTAYPGELHALGTAIVSAFAMSVPWGLLAFVVLSANRYLWRRAAAQSGTLALQWLCGVVLTYALVSFAWLTAWPVVGLESALARRGYASMLAAAWPRALAIYLGVWAVCEAGWLWRAYQHLHGRFVGTELRRLRGQLNPHFLFNTLSAISELGYQHPETADRTITQLSSLLRKALDGSQQREIALRDELDFLQRYLDIQQILLPGRLDIEMAVDDDTLNARVPGMILQPLVENAITHGIGRSGRGWVRIAALRRADTLVLEVQDSGWGFAARETRTHHEGIGIRNTRARLGYLYGAIAGLELRSRPGEGLMARLSIPFHEAYAYDEDSYPDR
ncbi:MAG: sensor histidine kinase [Gammaproteobacteria bacterium]